MTRKTIRTYSFHISFNIYKKSFCLIQQCYHLITRWFRYACCCCCCCSGGGGGNIAAAAAATTGGATAPATWWAAAAAGAAGGGREDLATGAEAKW